MDVKAKAKEALHRAREFELKPPYWFYWVSGAVIVLLVQAIRLI